MTTTPKAPHHPEFGTFLRDSLWADGKGGSLNWPQYKAAKEARELHEKAVKYQDSHGMPQ